MALMSTWYNEFELNYFELNYFLQCDETNNSILLLFSIIRTGGRLIPISKVNLRETASPAGCYPERNWSYTAHWWSDEAIAVNQIIVRLWAAMSERILFIISIAFYPTALAQWYFSKWKIKSDRNWRCEHFNLAYPESFRSFPLLWNANQHSSLLEKMNNFLHKWKISWHDFSLPSTSLPECTEEILNSNQRKNIKNGAF